MDDDIEPSLPARDLQEVSRCLTNHQRSLRAIAVDLRATARKMARLQEEANRAGRVDHPVTVGRIGDIGGQVEDIARQLQPWIAGTEAKEFAPVFGEAPTLPHVPG